MKLVRGKTFFFFFFNNFLKTSNFYYYPKRERSFEWYDPKLITELSKHKGPTQIFLYSLIFTLCFHHSKLTNFGLEWWKHKTRIRCFQKLRYITQWHHCKFLNSVEPTTFVLSCQLRDVTVAIQGENHFSFSFPSKYFSQTFPPFLTSLSPFSFSLLFESVDSDGGGIGCKWFCVGVVAASRVSVDEAWRRRQPW